MERRAVQERPMDRFFKGRFWPGSACIAQPLKAGDTDEKVQSARVDLHSKKCPHCSEVGMIGD